MSRGPLLLVSLVCLAPAVSAQQLVFQAGRVIRGTLSFDGKATTGDFTGSTTTVTGEMTGGELGAVRGWVQAPVTTLMTGNSKRDRDLNKSMESGQYPTIKFTLDGATAAGGGGDSLGVMLHGTFDIHGVSRAVEIPGTLVVRPGEVQVRADTPMNLKDYEIGGLTKFLGFLKMDPAIVVHVDVVFSQ